MNSNLLNLALRQAARNLSISSKLAEIVYRSYWAFIRDYAESQPIRTLSEEEFKEATTNFNIPYIGKLYVDYDKIEKYKRQLKRYENARAKKNKASRQSSVGD